MPYNICTFQCACCWQEQTAYNNEFLFTSSIITCFPFLGRRMNIPSMQLSQSEFSPLALTFRTSWARLGHTEVLFHQLELWSVDQKAHIHVFSDWIVAYNTGIFYLAQYMIRWYWKPCVIYHTIKINCDQNTQKNNFIGHIKPQVSQSRATGKSLKLSKTFWYIYLR